MAEKLRRLTDFDSRTKIDNILVENNILMRKLIEAQNQTNLLLSQNQQLLRAINQKDFSVSLPSVKDIKIEKESEREEIITGIRRFLYDVQSDKYYLVMNVLMISGGSTVAAKTYIGGTVEPTWYNMRDDFGTKPIAFLQYDVMGGNNGDLTGLHAYFGHKPNKPIIGAYGLAAYGKRTPLGMKEDEHYTINWNPPQVALENETIRVGYLNLDAANGTFSYVLRFAELEMVSDSNAKRFNLKSMLK